MQNIPPVKNNPAAKIQLEKSPDKVYNQYNQFEATMVAEGIRMGIPKLVTNQAIAEEYSDYENDRSGDNFTQTLAILDELTVSEKKHLQNTILLYTTEDDYQISVKAIYLSNKLQTMMENPNLAVAIRKVIQELL
jgi:ribosomal protein S17E